MQTPIQSFVVLGEVKAGGLWWLFTQSFDAFTVVLVLGSVIGLAWAIKAMLEIRGGAIMPRGSVRTIQDLAWGGRWEELKGYVARDESAPSRILREVFSKHAADRAGVRELAEVASSDEVSRWFRKIELLSVIGNLGPLVGLAGTVWGMILAFTALGESGGQAGPTDLSLGISKALFHTLLGLCLAIPCLLVYGVYRGIVDRHCTGAMLLVAKVLERAPIDASALDKGRGTGA
jgi:biopolymer transport protein ExbB